MDINAGSFWASYSVEESVTNRLSMADQTVEKVLEWENIIQNFRDEGEVELRNWMCKKEHVKQLIELITVEPPPNSSKDRAHRYPFVVCELFNCECHQLLGSVAQDDELLEVFFDFLFKDQEHHGLMQSVSDDGSSTASEEEPDDEDEDLILAIKEDGRSLNPVLAGYFTKVAMLLVGYFPTHVSNFLRNREEQLFKAFVRHIRCRSVIEFIVRLLVSKDLEFDSADFLERVIPLTSDIGADLPSFLDELMSQRDMMQDRGKKILITIMKSNPSLLLSSTNTNEVSAGVSLCSSLLQSSADYFRDEVVGFDSYTGLEDSGGIADTENEEIWYVENPSDNIDSLSQTHENIDLQAIVSEVTAVANNAMSGGGLASPSNGQAASFGNSCGGQLSSGTTNSTGSNESGGSPAAPSSNANLDVTPPPLEDNVHVTTNARKAAREKAAGLKPPGSPGIGLARKISTGEGNDADSPTKGGESAMKQPESGAGSPKGTESPSEEAETKKRESPAKGSDPPPCTSPSNAAAIGTAETVVGIEEKECTINKSSEHLKSPDNAISISPEKPITTHEIMIRAMSKDEDEKLVFSPKPRSQLTEKFYDNSPEKLPEGSGQKSRKNSPEKSVDSPEKPGGDTKSKSVLTDKAKDSETAISFDSAEELVGKAKTEESLDSKLCSKDIESANTMEGKETSPEIKDNDNNTADLKETDLDTKPSDEILVDDIPAPSGTQTDFFADTGAVELHNVDDQRCNPGVADDVSAGADIRIQSRENMVSRFDGEKEFSKFLDHFEDTFGVVAQRMDVFLENCRKEYVEDSVDLWVRDQISRSSESEEVMYNAAILGSQVREYDTSLAKSSQSGDSPSQSGRSQTGDSLVDSSKKESKTQPVSLYNIFELICLFTSFINSNAGQTSGKVSILMKKQIPHKAVELFFLRPWNSILHNNLVILFRGVLSTHCLSCQEKVAFFRESQFFERAFMGIGPAPSRPTKAGRLRPFPRKGYYPHLMEIFDEIDGWAKEECMLQQNFLQLFQTANNPSNGETDWWSNCLRHLHWWRRTISGHLGASPPRTSPSSPTATVNEPLGGDDVFDTDEPACVDFEQLPLHDAERNDTFEHGGDFSDQGDGFGQGSRGFNQEGVANFDPNVSIYDTAAVFSSGQWPEDECTPPGDDPFKKVDDPFKNAVSSIDKEFFSQPESPLEVTVNQSDRGSDPNNFAVFSVNGNGFANFESNNADSSNSREVDPQLGESNIFNPSCNSGSSLGSALGQIMQFDENLIENQSSSSASDLLGDRLGSIDRTITSESNRGSGSGLYIRTETPPLHDDVNASSSSSASSDGRVSPKIDEEGNRVVIHGNRTVSSDGNKTFASDGILKSPQAHIPLSNSAPAEGMEGEGMPFSYNTSKHSDSPQNHRTYTPPLLGDRVHSNDRRSPKSLDGRGSPIDGSGRDIHGRFGGKRSPSPVVGNNSLIGDIDGLGRDLGLSPYDPTMDKGVILDSSIYRSTVVSPKAQSPRLAIGSSPRLVVQNIAIGQTVSPRVQNVSPRVHSSPRIHSSPRMHTGSSVSSSPPRSVSPLDGRMNLNIASPSNTHAVASPLSPGSGWSTHNYLKINTSSGDAGKQPSHVSSPGSGSASKSPEAGQQLNRSPRSGSHKSPASGRSGMSKSPSYHHGSGKCHQIQVARKNPVDGVSPLLSILVGQSEPPRDLEIPRASSKHRSPESGKKSHSKSSDSAQKSAESSQKSPDLGQASPELASKSPDSGRALSKDGTAGQDETTRTELHDKRQPSETG